MNGRVYPQQWCWAASQGLSTYVTHFPPLNSSPVHLVLPVLHTRPPYTKVERTSDGIRCLGEVTFQAEVKECRGIHEEALLSLLNVELSDCPRIAQLINTMDSALGSLGTVNPTGFSEKRALLHSTTL